MCERPPDELIVQTHTHLVVRQIAALQELARGCRLRVHVSIETDRERFEGLPPHASSVARRFDACAALRAAGLPTVVTVSPLLPIGDPEAFFQKIAQVADAVVIDHFIEGDGSVEGRRTFQTPLPAVMESVLPGATSLSYRDDMAAVARRHLPGRVGISIDGFAGRFTAVDPETFE